MMRAPAAALTCAMSLAGFGCAGGHDAERALAKRATIIDGEPSGASEDGVVLIRVVLEDGREELCSAGLVGANLLVTARHCVSYLQEGQFSCSVRGELINGADGAGRVGLHFPAESIAVYGGAPPRPEPLAHGLQVLSTLSETVCSNDLAFVVLDTALALPVIPMRIGRPARFGEASVQIGYGLQRGQTELSYETQPRMRKAGLSIAGVGPDSLEEGVTTVAPRTLLVEGPAGCVGDSGGPLVAAATGALLGVYSLQQGDNCASSGVRNFLEHVPPFERLIADAFAAAGTEPLLEPELTEGTGGAAGASSVEESGRGGEGAEPAPSGGGPSKRRDSGCAFGNHQERASGACAGLLMLGVLWRRLSDGRRAGRRPSSAFPRV